MKKKLVVLLIAALTLSSMNPAVVMANQVPVVASTSLEQVISGKASMLNTMLGGTSMQYALIDAGEIVLSGNTGVYSKSENKALTDETMYGIGSISKMYVTAAVMQLVDEGKIDLDTPLTTYIPEFKMADERYKDITPRMLLNHSSGLMGSSFRGSFLFNDADTYAVDSLLTQLEGQRLKADPGAYSVYCNDGFTLAQILVERVSGMDFTSFIHKAFTEPLGLTNTKTPIDEFDTNELAKAYYPTYNGELPVESVNVIGTGGIYATAEDLCKFSEIFMHGQKDILSEDALKAMETNEAEKGIWVKDGDNSFEYGLGWDNMNVYPFNEYGIKALVKGGDTQLYHGSLIVLPEHNMAAAVVSSGGASTYDQMLATTMLLEQLKAKGIIDEIKPAKVPVAPVKADMPKELISESGIYMAMGGAAYEVQIKETGELVLKALTMPVPEQTFIYTTEGVFVSPDGSTQVQVVEESNGHKYLWAKGYGSLPGIGEIAISDYQLQKMEPNEVSEEVNAAWQARNGKKYFIIDEKYSSQVYLTMPASLLMLDSYLPGYVIGNKIIDANNAQSVIQIPGMNGRDLQDIQIFEKDQVEYAKIGGYTTISEDAIPDLANATEAICTIGEEGYARWFTVPAALANKTIALTIPANGAAMVYDMHGQLVDNTYISGNATVTLPEKGYVVFAGNAGVQFSYTVQ